MGNLRQLDPLMTPHSPVMITERRPDTSGSQAAAKLM
jgi:hypothetical protein